MKTEFRKARIPGELDALIRFDRRIFPASDCFDADYWRKCDGWWLIVSGRKAGCCAFEKPAKGSRELYVATTGVLPKYRGLGFGQLMKAWQTAYGARRGFRRIFAHSRESNAAMIAINLKFGFKIMRTVANYYSEPTEAAVFMKLEISKR